MLLILSLAAQQLGKSMFCKTKLSGKVTFLNLQYEVKGGVFEQRLNHPVVQVVENRLNDATYHAHAHCIRFCLKFLEDIEECQGEGRGVEEIVFNQIFRGFGFVQYVREIVLVGNLQGIASADLEVVLADFFANQPPRLYRQLRTKKCHTPALPRRKSPNPRVICAPSHSRRSLILSAFSSYSGVAYASALATPSPSTPTDSAQSSFRSHRLLSRENRGPRGCIRRCPARL